jgi:hypothetical protein
MKTHHILSLGAGVQSTTLYLLAMHGDFPCEAAIFADTQEEPEAVYLHLEWLKAQCGPPIMVRTRGSLGDDLTRGENSTHQRFASIPAFTSDGNGAAGMTRRQCSREYKTQVVEQAIRREIVGLAPGRALRNLNQSLYLHRSCKPITEIDFANYKQASFDGFLMECQGMCGV